MKNNAASYKKAAILSASPERLVLMLFDGALEAMQRAIDGFEIDDLKERNETVSNSLIKAQNIFAELQRSLRVDKGGAFADNMFQLYDFYSAKLNEANFKKDPKPVETVLELFVEIRDAWAEMLSKQKSKAEVVAPASSAGVGAGLSLRA